MDEREPVTSFDRARRAMLGRVAGLGGVTALAGMTLPVSAEEVSDAAAGAISVARFLSPQQRAAAQTDHPADCTDAFTRALAAHRSVEVGKGQYALAGLRLPVGARLLGDPGAILHQARPDRPAVHCLSDVDTGQLTGIVMDALEIIGHPDARSSLVLVEAHGAFAVIGSRLAFTARRSFRALEVQGADANNIYRCRFDVVSEDTRDAAVLVNGGVYNNYALFLTRARGWGLDDASNGSVINVVADNCIIIRGQTNQVTAVVEGLGGIRPASDAAITDRGYGNVFFYAQVNMPGPERGKLRYAFRAFEHTVFIGPQILGEGAPVDPFAPTSNMPFTVIGGRSGAAHKVERVFDGSDGDHDRRNITFVGDARDYTDLPTYPGTVVLERFQPRAGATVALAATTQVALIDAPGALASLRIAFAGGLAPRDGWMLTLRTSAAIAVLEWPPEPRFGLLPRQLEAGASMRLIYDARGEAWVPV